MRWCKLVKAFAGRGIEVSSGRLSTIRVGNCEECESDVISASRRSLLPGADKPRKRTDLRRGKRKGCDIGYAPAISSCEGANRVDACTVAALDAITAFADPNPNCSSQNQSVFSGLVARQVALLSRSLSLLRSGKVYFANPFSRRRQPN
jgi:hypothetical protein